MVKVLVIDDDIGCPFNVYHKDFLKIYGKIEGFEFVFCDGKTNFDLEVPFEVQKVIDFVNANMDADIILLDKTFGVNPQFGIVVLKQLKKLGVNIPVIMFTSEVSQVVVKECLAAGVTGFLQKDPWLSAEEFKKSVEEFLYL
ncbi:MAG: response regulator [bacterium]|nr:response regulator [bacterium]